MKIIRIIFITLLLPIMCGCYSFAKLGTYDISGKIIDKQKKTPVSGVTVEVVFSANDMNGDCSFLMGKTETDKNGYFIIKKNPKWVRGGSGGLAGSIMKTPCITLKKEEYYTVSFLDFEMKAESSYQKMEFMIKKKE